MLTAEKIAVQLQTLDAIKLAFNAYIPVVNSAGDKLRENLKTDDSAELVAIAEAFNANVRALNAAGSKVGETMRQLRANPLYHTAESADGTTVPPATSILDSIGRTWAFSARGWPTRDGNEVAWGRCLTIAYVAKEVYVQGDSGSWYRITGKLGEEVLLQIASSPTQGGGIPVPPAAATALTLTAPVSGTSGTVGIASGPFIIGANGVITGTVIVTPTSSAGTGFFTPTTVSISAASTIATFTYTPTSIGARSISATNNGGLAAPSPETYTALTDVVPQPEPIGTRVPLTDGGDGPDWWVSNIFLSYGYRDQQPFGNYRDILAWRNLGGDYLDANGVEDGPTHYATAQLTAAGVQDMVFNVAALTQDLLDGENTGIFFKMLIGSSAGAEIASRTHPNLPGPALHVVTSMGVFDPPCIADTYSSSSSPSGSLGGAIVFYTPGMMKFNMTGVVGTVSSATLTLKVAVIYGNPPQTFAVDKLDMPPLITSPATQMGGVVQGIANSVAGDSALASHPSVLFYSQFTSLAQLNANWWNAQTHIFDFVPWAEYGITAVRVESMLTTQGILNLHKLFQPVSNPSWPSGAPAGITRSFGTQAGYNELYMRYILMIDPDVSAGFTEFGVKLPGMSGVYELSGSGAVTLPQPTQADLWYGQMEHGREPPSLPDHYRLYWYWYGADNAPYPSGYLGSRGASRFTDVVMKAGQKYSIEQRVKLNTLGVADGILQVWVDGVKVYEDTAVNMRNSNADVQIQDAPWLLIYHGGTGLPSAPFHYEVSGVCTSTQYIGPPKSIGMDLTTTPPTFIPARDGTSLVTNWAGLPLNTWCQIQNTEMTDLLPQLPVNSNASDMANVFNAWGSSALDTATSDMHHHGGAHGANAENNGWYTFNIKKAQWRVCVQPVYMDPAGYQYMHFVVSYLHPALKTQGPWQANTAYAASIRIHPTVKNGHAYISSAAGTSGATEPVFPTSGAVGDGTITWTRTHLHGDSHWNNGYNYGMPPYYIFLPVPGTTSLVPEPTHLSPNATSSGKHHVFHCWNKLAWVNWIGTGRIFGSNWHLWLLDPVNGAVTVKQQHGDTNGQQTVADPVTQRIYGLTNFGVSDFWGFREYDPVADVIVANYPLTLQGSGYFFNSTNDPAMRVVGREIFFLETTWQKFFAFHMDTKVWRAITLSQPVVFDNDWREFSMVYVPELGKLLACQNRGKLWQIDVTGTVNVHPTVGSEVFATGSGANGLYGRLQYWQEHKILIATENAGTNVKVMRLA